MNICHYTFVQPTKSTSSVSPKVNCGLWVIMIYQCRFSLCKKYIILVSDADNWVGWGYACVGTGEVGNICTSSQFHCKPKLL